MVTQSWAARDLSQVTSCAQEMRKTHRCRSPFSCILPLCSTTCWIKIMALTQSTWRHSTYTVPVDSTLNVVGIDIPVPILSLLLCVSWIDVVLCALQLQVSQVSVKFWVSSGLRSCYLVRGHDHGNKLGGPISGLSQDIFMLMTLRVFSTGTVVDEAGWNQWWQLISL